MDFDLLGHEASRRGRELTVLLRGDFTARAAERFADAVQTLPHDIQALCLDLRDVDVVDEVTVSILRELTDWWRARRDGGARLLFTTAGIISAWRPAFVPDGYRSLAR